ncbi:MAG: AMP-binding protein, partial [Pseudomonadota bacterium]
MSPPSSTRLPWYRALRAPAADRENPPCIHVAVADALRAAPGRTLLVDETRAVDNATLLRHVDARARQLRARTAGARAPTAALRLDNGIEAVVAYFACLAAGVRYLPLPAQPPAVLGRLIDALAPDVVITRHAAVPDDAADPVLVDDPVPDHDIALPRPDPRRIAHVLLTSGSESGQPKAVLTDHVGSMHAHRWRARRWPYRAGDVVGCNIFGIWDVVPALLHGVPAVLIGDATMRDAEALAATIVRFGITRMMLTPTLLQACLASDVAVDALARTHRLVLCGEPVPEALVRQLRHRLPEVAVSDLYSISECHDVAARELSPGASSRGQVADFAEVHVADPQTPETLVTAGHTGRVLVGGRALARGYLDPEATARRFYTTGFGGRVPEGRVYDTGDLGRLHRDGTLEIVGRADQALKVRGTWVEPDTVAAILREHPRVARAVVIADTAEGAAARLRAYVVPADPGAGTAVADDLRRHARAHLGPQSMPGVIRVVEELPLLPSGKVNRRALRALDDGGDGAEAGDRGASLERTVVALFREVLAAPRAGPEDGFDALGGDSLAAIVLCGRLQRATGRPVRVRELHRYATPAALARHLARRPSAPPARPALPALELDIA